MQKYAIIKICLIRAFIYYIVQFKNQVFSMLHTLITDNASIRDVLVSRLSLKKRNDADAHHGVTFYQKESWILAYHPTALDEAQTQAQEEYNPSRIYALFLGASIDVDHEIGDVVLPNVFFYYTPEIATTEITESNRDHI